MNDQSVYTFTSATTNSSGGAGTLEACPLAERAPRIHCMDARRREKHSLHLSQLMVQLLQRYAHAHIRLHVLAPEASMCLPLKSFSVYSIYLPAVGSVLFVYEENDVLEKAGSLQAQRSHVLRTFSRLLTRQMPVLFPQTTILALERCHSLLNNSVWTSSHKTTTTLCVFYGQSYAIYIAIQRACCPPVY